MRFAAVIFDLFGTLVDLFPYQEYQHELREMAKVLCAPPDDLVRLWRDTWEERATGAIPTLEAIIEHLCHTLGLQPTEAQLAAAARIRLALTQRNLTPRRDAVATLEWLKTSGVKTGLISDCTCEVPLLWPATPFAPLIEAPVFSCAVGLKKPAPQIYEIACERLGVRPEDCLYVGDGSSRELTGAAAVGMTPVLIRVPHEDTHEALRYEAEDWEGPMIRALSEVRGLLE